MHNDKTTSKSVSVSKNTMHSNWKVTYFGKLQNHEQKIEAILTTRNLKLKFILNKQEHNILIINKHKAIYNISWNL